jgi:hypothetical protein
MKIAVRLIERMRIQNKPPLLGRWGITYCKKIQNKRIDLANEDHCGVCYSTKYHNNTYIKHINGIKYVASDNAINANRLNVYLNNIKYINNMKNKNESNSGNKNNSNPIIDLE